MNVSIEKLHDVGLAVAGYLKGWDGEWDAERSLVVLRDSDVLAASHVAANGSKRGSADETDH